jgi:signal transduction histidine kinase
MRRPAIQHRFRKFVGDLSLSQRFTLASFVILLAGLLGVGAWVQRQIETGVIHRTGVTTALYVESFVAPLLQELGQSDDLSPAAAGQLADLLQDTPLGRQIVSFKVWNPRGYLLYSTEPGLAGRTFPMTEGLLRARLGEVVTEISQLQAEENASLAAEHDELLETYSPVWLSGTNQVIAVAEFYHSTETLNQEIAALRLRSWLVVGAAILIIFLLLAGFVRRASHTIDRQRAELAEKVYQLTQLLAQNDELHQRVRRAAASVSLLNEGYLHRIGAELHDGPTQALGLSLLRVDSLIAELEAEEATASDGLHQSLTEIEASLRGALDEMRGIAAGLSLPLLADLDVASTIVRAVRAHERRSGTKVALELGQLPDQLTMPLKTTVYRLVQEALNNAFRHAGGAGQAVSVGLHGDQLRVEVTDTGPGFDPDTVADDGQHLGLTGMRERVESLGGVFNIESQPGKGTRIRARFPIRLEEGRLA